MSELQIKKIFCVVAVILVFIPLGIIAQTPEPTATPCMDLVCAGVSQADLFLRAFSGNKDGLVTIPVGQEQQIRLAFYGIDATYVEIEKGRLTESEGKIIIDRYKQTIDAYVTNRGLKAIEKAQSGQYSDFSAISELLGPLLTVARDDKLKNHEELAKNAQKQMVKVLTTFSKKFAETCQDQSFPVGAAIGLGRQNEMLGTNISLNKCMTRKFTADLSSQGVNYHLESCSDLFNSFVWDVKISGRVVGEGKVTGNKRWEADVIFQGRENHSTGNIDFVKEIIEENKEDIKAPNDAGPNAKPNGWASAPVPNPQLARLRIPKDKLRMTTIVLTGERGFEGFTGHLNSWVEAEIIKDDKPCSPVTQNYNE